MWRNITIQSYSYLGKALEKQTKTIEDQGKKQVEALNILKPKEQTKAIEGKPNNQSSASIIFNDLIKERESIMNKLYESFDYNNLEYEYAGFNKNMSFYEYMDSKELFSEIKNNRIKFDDAQKKNRNSF